MSGPSQLLLQGACGRRAGGSVLACAGAALSGSRGSSSSGPAGGGGAPALLRCLGQGQLPSSASLIHARWASAAAGSGRAGDRVAQPVHGPAGAGAADGAQAAGTAAAAGGGDAAAPSAAGQHAAFEMLRALGGRRFKQELKEAGLWVATPTMQALARPEKQRVVARQQQYWLQRVQARGGEAPGPAWLPGDAYSRLTAEQRADLERQRRHFKLVGQQREEQLRLLEACPAAGMAVVALNPHQLPVAVAAAAGVPHALLASPQCWGAGARPARAYSTGADGEALAAAQEGEARDGSSDGGGRQGEDAKGDLEPAASEQHKQQDRQQQQQQRRQRQQGEQGAAPGAPPAWGGFVTQPPLAPSDLLKESAEQLVINLNTQLRNASEDRKAALVVQLFDSFLAKGLEEGRAAAARAQEQQEQAAAAAAGGGEQQGEGGGAQEQQEQRAPKRQPVRALPPAYRPDDDTLSTYCRALVWVSEDQDREDRSRWEASKAARDGVAAYSPTEQLCTVDRAEAAAALWGARGLAGPGVWVHLALTAAYCNEGLPHKALELFWHLQATQPPKELHKHYRLHFAAAQAAIAARKFEAADQISRAFSSNAVPFTARQYVSHVSRLYRSLVRAAATTGNWEQALHWLQQLINHDSLLPVQPINFLVVLDAAAAAGRMDYVRVMMTALDRQSEARGKGRYTYKEPLLLRVIAAAGRAGDAPLVEDAWQRLLADAQAAPAAAGAKGGAEAAEPEGPGAKQARAAAGASAAAHQARIRAYVDSQAWGKALDALAEMERAHGAGSSACSVYGGLAFFPRALRSERLTVAVFSELMERKKRGAPLSPAMLNVVSRAVARLGNTEEAGRMFEGYGAMGLQPDADSYNSVIESCEAAAKVAAVEGLLSYMAGKGVEPNSASWNLLLSTALRARDGASAASALQRMAGAGVEVRQGLADRAAAVAAELRDGRLREALLQAARQQGIRLRNTRQLAFQRAQQQPGGEREQGGGGAGSRRDVWRPGMGPRPARQQQQQPAGADAAAAGGSAGGRRAGLRAALGAAGADGGGSGEESS